MTKEKIFVDKLKYENELIARGKTLIAGVDEVGRGPLAGPVVTAAVIMPLDKESIIEGIDDSKKVCAKKREMLYDLIMEKAIAISVCRIEEDEIDRINILRATEKCMMNSIQSLKVKPQAVLIDAVKLSCDAEVVSLIKGDALSYSIGAASIVAKVYRDRLMDEYAKQYPEYGFEKHKGYGTKQHIEAIREVGACPIHRKTFIKNFVE